MIWNSKSCRHQPPSKLVVYVKLRRHSCRWHWSWRCWVIFIEAPLVLHRSSPSWVPHDFWVNDLQWYPLFERRRGERAVILPESIESVFFRSRGIFLDSGFLGSSYFALNCSPFNQITFPLAVLTRAGFLKKCWVDPGHSCILATGCGDWGLGDVWMLPGTQLMPMKVYGALGQGPQRGSVSVKDAAIELAFR